MGEAASFGGRGSRPCRGSVSQRRRGPSAIEGFLSLLDGEDATDLRWRAVARTPRIALTGATPERHAECGGSPHRCTASNAQAKSRAERRRLPTLAAAEDGHQIRWGRVGAVGRRRPFWEKAFSNSRIILTCLRARSLRWWCVPATKPAPWRARHRGLGRVPGTTESAGACRISRIRFRRSVRRHAVCAAGALARVATPQLEGRVRAFWPCSRARHEPGLP